MDFSKSELIVDDPARQGKIDVDVDVSLPFIACECKDVKSLFESVSIKISVLISRMKTGGMK